MFCLKVRVGKNQTHLNKFIKVKRMQDPNLPKLSNTLGVLRVINNQGGFPNVVVYCIFNTKEFTVVLGVQEMQPSPPPPCAPMHEPD